MTYDCRSASKLHYRTCDPQLCRFVHGQKLSADDASDCDDLSLQEEADPCS